jgi:hypothetical protein
MCAPLLAVFKLPQGISALHLGGKLRNCKLRHTLLGTFQKHPLFSPPSTTYGTIVTLDIEESIKSSGGEEEGRQRGHQSNYGQNHQSAKFYTKYQELIKEGLFQPLVFTCNQDLINTEC